MNPDTVAAIYRRNMTRLIDEAAANERRRRAQREHPRLAA